MPKARVAILRTRPETVLRDYHRLLNLADYQSVIAKDADTALKVNISWHFFFPGSSTTPWQLEGVIRAMKKDGYSPALMHACHNRTVVIDAHLGERENKQSDTCFGCRVLLLAPERPPVLAEPSVHHGGSHPEGARLPGRVESELAIAPRNVDAVEAAHSRATPIIASRVTSSTSPSSDASLVPGGRCGSTR